MASERQQFTAEYGAQQVVDHLRSRVDLFTAQMSEAGLEGNFEIQSAAFAEMSPLMSALSKRDELSTQLGSAIAEVLAEFGITDEDQIDMVLDAKEGREPELVPPSDKLDKEDGGTEVTIPSIYISVPETRMLYIAKNKVLQKTCQNSKKSRKHFDNC